MPVIPLFFSGAVDDSPVPDDGSGHLLLRVGALDLSSFLRLQPNDGADPYDADGFLEPQFQQNPYSEGSALTNVAVDNRVQSWPLFLNKADKDLLHVFVAELNRELQQRPLEVQWRDAGAAHSTFYDVSFAQFVPEWSFWRGVNSWLAGRLTIYCTPPFGHTGTTRVGASLAGVGATLPFASMAVSGLDGDAPALVDVSFSAATLQYSLDFPVYSFVAVAPKNWKAWWGASDLSTLVGAATVTRASGAIASTVLRAVAMPTVPAVKGAVPGIMQLQDDVADTGVNPGRNRLLAVARSAASYGGLLSARRKGHADTFTAIPAVVGASGGASGGWGDWTLVDLGVYDRGSTDGLDDVELLAGVPSGQATSSIDVAGVLALPEDSTMLTVDPLGDFIGTVSSEHTAMSNIAYHLTAIGTNGMVRRGDPPNALTDVSAYSIGAAPKLHPGASESIIAGLLPVGRVNYPAQRFDVAVSVRERFHFAR